MRQTEPINKKRDGPQFIAEPQHIEGYKKVVTRTNPSIMISFCGLITRQRSELLKIAGDFIAGSFYIVAISLDSQGYRE